MCGWLSTMRHNGCVYETFGISKHLSVKLQVLLIRAETLDNPLTAKCFIYDVVCCGYLSYYISKILLTNLYARFSPVSGFAQSSIAFGIDIIMYALSKVTSALSILS